MCEISSKLKVGLCPGLTFDIVSALQENGIYTVSELISLTVEQLAATTHLPCKELVAIHHVLVAQFAALPVSAVVLFDDIMKSVSILSTGCKSLDDYLDGGIYTKEVMEIVGEVASAKTQFCLSVAVELAVNSKLNTLWVDTCGSFDLARLQLMLDQRHLSQQDSSDACSRLQVISAFNALDILVAFEKVRSLLSDQTSCCNNVRLIVIDTVSVLLSSLLSEYTLQGHGVLVHVSRSIKDIVCDYPVAVLMTNAIIGSTAPALGRVWTSTPNTRLLLHRESTCGIYPGGKMPNNDQPVRFAALIKSSKQVCQGSVPFFVSDYGILDIHKCA